MESAAIVTSAAASVYHPTHQELHGHRKHPPNPPVSITFKCSGVGKNIYLYIFSDKQPKKWANSHFFQLKIQKI